MTSFLNKSTVMEVLVEATRQDASNLKSAEEKLKNWETQPGFYTLLNEVFTDKSLDTNVRWLAVLCFKNGIERHWRPFAPNALSDAEKTELKRSLISSFHEPVNQIAVQLAVLIGKIARLDCPKHWPELIPVLLETVKCSDTLSQQRSLLTLHHVVKALASKRLAPDRKMFEDLTSNIFEFLLMLWNSYTETFFHCLQINDHNKACLVLDYSLMSLKVLRRLVVFGFKNPEEKEVVTHFLNLVFQRIDLFCKTNMEAQKCTKDKLLILLTKIILEFQEYHAEAFIPFIRQSLELMVQCNFMDQTKGSYVERFQVNTFNITKSILRCDKYKPAKSTVEMNHSSSVPPDKIKVDFFTPGILSEILRRLILEYFLLNKEDLLTWDSDPEEFVRDEGGDSWKYCLRPCTESLFLALMKEFRAVLCPLMLTLIKEYEGPANTNDLSALLEKDAVMNAVGLASFELYDEIDFDTWFQTSLMNDLQCSHSNYRIIRRRVIWLLGCWVGVKMSSEMRPVLYQILIPYLSAKEDMVVRLETAYTIRCAVDDFDFDVDHFLPYLEAYFSSLFNLLKDSNECEIKMQVLHVMSFIVERMKREIIPYAETLICYLPLLWKNAEEHNMLQCAIITTSTNLVWSLGAHCMKMYEFLLPAINFATDVKNEHHVYLYEDGLDLWLATLQCSPVINKDLLHLFENLPAVLELGGESFRICIKVIESYILLAPTQFLQTYGASLVAALASSLTDLKNEGVVMVYKVVELTLRIVPEEGPHLFMTMLPNIIFSLLKEQEYPMVCSIKLAILARIILQNLRFFSTLLQELSCQWKIEAEEILVKLVQSWLDKIDNIIQTDKKKLSTLALVSLLSNKKILGSHFAAIINSAVETLHDVCRTDDHGKQQDSFCMDSTTAKDFGTDECETEHDKRKQTLSKHDPVYNICLISYISSRLQLCREEFGVQMFEALMGTVDKEIVEQLKQFIS